MLLQKMVVEFLGGSEYALRLVPLLCSIISVVLFYHLVRRFCRPVIVPLAMMVFSVSSPLMFLAAEAKQYGVEVFLSIAALLVMLWVFDQKKLSIARTVGFSIFGAAVLWLSHGVVFILAGGGSVLGLKSMRDRRWEKTLKLAAVGCFWFVSFLVSFHVSSRDMSSNTALINFWKGQSAGGTILSVHMLSNHLDSFLNMFIMPAGFKLTSLAAFCFGAGAITLWREDSFKWGLMIVPIVLCLAVSWMNYYVFYGRFLFFTAPVLVIFVIYGAGSLVKWTWPESRVLGVLLIVGLLVPNALVKPHHKREELRPVLEYVQRKRKPGESVYVYYGAKSAFQYYSSRMDFDTSEVTYGEKSRADWTGYLEQIRHLEGRVWIIESHICTWNGVHEGKLLQDYMNLHGKMLEHYPKPGAAAYLYEFPDR